jgi:hypothetical protein
MGNQRIKTVFRNGITIHDQASRGKRARGGNDRHRCRAVKEDSVLIGLLVPRRTAGGWKAESRYLLGAALRHSQKMLARPAL